MPKDEIDHGRRGRILVTSQWNTDREPPSRQVWVEIWHNGKCLATSSGNLVEDLGLVDLGCSPENAAPSCFDENLTREEFAFVEKIMAEFEGRPD